MRSVRIRQNPTSARTLTGTALVAALISILLILLIWLGGLFNTVRLRLGDLYFVGNEVSDNLVIIALDDASLNAYGRSPAEWDRSVYADLVDILAAGGTRAIGFDLLFFEPTDQDEVLATALRNARDSDARTRIVLPVAGADTMGVECPTNADGVAFPMTLYPVDTLAETADYLAYVNTVIDVDSVIRRQPSLICTEDGRALSFPLAVYLAMLRIPSSVVDQVVTTDGNQLAIADRPALIGDDYGIWRQNFTGRRGESFPTYSLVDVVEGEITPETFADKIVLVGLINSQGAPDRYPVPVSTDGQPMAGVEILAHAIQTLIRQDLLYGQSPVSIAVMIVVLSLGSAFIYVRVRWYAKVALSLLLVLMLFILMSFNFSLRGEIADTFEGSLAILFPAALCIGFEVRSERQARQQAEALFESVEGQRRLVDAIFMRSPMAMALINSGMQIIRTNNVFESTIHSTKPDIIARFVDAGLTTDAQTEIRLAFKEETIPEIKTKLGEITYFLRAALIHESDFRVVTLIDVTSIEQLATLKARLIRIAAHDVRNPLSSIMGFVELLQLDPTSLTERQFGMLQRIKTSGDTINTIMTNLLKLEQLRSAVMPLEPYSVKILLSPIAESHAPDMERRNHEFSLQIEDDLPLIEAEPVQLGQAISNLLSNAAKYTPDEGKITLRAVLAKNQKVLISVEDNGFGIPNAAQAELFNEFYRVNTGPAAEVAGTGLGLSLVRTIIEAHKGRVWVESEEGKGSTFFIELNALPNTTNVRQA